MDIVNIHEAKTHLSRLIKKAAEGDSFVIAKAGEPLVTVSPYKVPAQKQVRRIGFMVGQITVPEDFDRMERSEIAQLFEGHE